jgi:excisionase family DNA binding protein
MALIDQATPLLALFLRLSAATGARRGEVCALRWDDVDLGARLVHIHRSVLQLPGRKVFIKDTKTHSERTVSIDVETAARLATRRAEVETALEGGSTIVELPYIFSNDAGERPWRPDYVTGAWRRLCDAAGIVGVRVHDLRHMHASYLLDAGVPLHTVSRRLGHERASTTSDIYGHAIDARDRGAAELFGTMLNEGAAGEEQGRSNGRQERSLSKASAAVGFATNRTGGAASVPGPSKGLGGRGPYGADGTGLWWTQEVTEALALAPDPLLRAGWRVALEPWRNVMEDRLTLTVGEAAQVLGVSRALAYELVARGELPSLRLGRRIVVPRRALEVLIAQATPETS